MSGARQSRPIARRVGANSLFFAGSLFFVRDRHLNYPSFDAEILRRTIYLFAESLDPEKLVLTMDDLAIASSKLRDKGEEELILDLLFLAVDLAVICQRRSDDINRGLANFDTTPITDEEEENAGARWAKRQLDTKSYALDLEDLSCRLADFSRYLFLRHVADGGKEEDFPSYLKNEFDSYTENIESWTFKDLKVQIASAMARALDPYTNVALKLGQKNIFTSAPHEELAGIGVSLKRKDGRFFIQQIYPGSPAEKGGQLSVGDEIISVESDSGKIDVLNQGLDSVVAAIRGEPGTIVTLKMRAVTDGREYHCDVQRGIFQVSLDSVWSQVVQMPSHLDAKNCKVGYIDIQGFYQGSESRPGESGTAKEVAQALRDFKKAEVDVVVLDLLDNGGGSRQAALDIIKLFIRRTALSIAAAGNREYPLGSLGSTIWDGPVVILTSKVSASAAEMLAAAFKSYKRGLIVGEKTFGKGTSQEVPEIVQRGSVALDVKITTQYFKAPDGSVVQHSGVKPDVFLRNRESSVRETNLPNSLKIGKGAKRTVKSYGLVDRSMVSELRDASTLRVKQTAQMQVLEDLVMRDKKTSSKIPLGRNEFTKRYKSERERATLA